MEAWAKNTSNPYLWGLERPIPWMWVRTWRMRRRSSPILAASLCTFTHGEVRRVKQESKADAGKSTLFIPTYTVLVPQKVQDRNWLNMAKTSLVHSSSLLFVQWKSDQRAHTLVDRNSQTNEIFIIKEIVKTLKEYFKYIWNIISKQK